MTRTAMRLRKIDKETDPLYALTDGPEGGAEVKEDRGGEVGQVVSNVSVVFFVFFFKQTNHQPGN